MAIVVYESAHFSYVCVCVCACVRAYVCVCVKHTFGNIFSLSEINAINAMQSFFWFWGKTGFVQFSPQRILIVSLLVLFVYLLVGIFMFA